MDALVLSNDQLFCSLRPDLGGSIEQLIYRGLSGDIAVLSAPSVARNGAAKTVREMVCFPLVPFSNRVAHAKMHWQGLDYALCKLGTKEAHAIHGVAWQRAWSVLQASADGALLSYTHAGDDAWPFAFEVVQEFEMQGSALVMRLRLTSQALAPAPIGLGWHPYFSKRPGAHLSFDATSRWQMGADKLPTLRQPASGWHSPCARLALDHCFEGWTGQAVLSDSWVTTQIDSSLSRLVVYTSPSQDFLALEPVSHVNNALHLGGASRSDLDKLGIAVLASGESVSAQMRICVAGA